jgi:COP9 signalosome complex subunit 5
VADVLQIDPHRTVSSGKVDIGAFRTYPEKYIPPDAEPSEYQSIPLNKIEDFGVHANQYYSLDVSHFKSALDSKVLDLLWNKYWVATLSQSPLIIVPHPQHTLSPRLPPLTVVERRLFIPADH